MKKRIAKDLLDIQAVFLKPQDPFTWASGIKSPIYCDNRLTLSYPNVREDVENALAEIIRKEYKNSTAENPVEIKSSITTIYALSIKLHSN